MTDLNIAQLMQTMGLKAKAASSQMARAPHAVKSKALLALAAMLRQNAVALAAANAKDLARATASGLAGPMLERL